SIAPGGVDTEGLQRIGIVGSEHEKALVAVTPLGRFGQSEDIAKVAVFLASDEAGWVSGERITAAGGWR
ncbi:SDR family oxidoreductase, partial [Mesorhizobium sp. M8A.F.Ca.ET.059.01.1.1]